MIPVCDITDCENPQGSREVILIRPDGAENRRHRRYCDAHTDHLLGVLKPEYSDGSPAVRVDVVT